MEPEHEAADLIADADQVAHSLSRLFRLMNHVSHHRGKHFADRTAHHLLAHLVANGPCRSNALADALHSDPSTVSRHVAQLVGEGLIERVADPVDGRATLLAITGSGIARMEDLRLQRNRAIAALIERWSPGERQDLGRLLGGFVDEYEGHLQEVLDALVEPSDSPASEPVAREGN